MARSFSLVKVGSPPNSSTRLPLRTPPGDRRSGEAASVLREVVKRKPRPSSVRAAAAVSTFMVEAGSMSSPRLLPSSALPGRDQADPTRVPPAARAGWFTAGMAVRGAEFRLVAAGRTWVRDGADTWRIWFLEAWDEVWWDTFRASASWIPAEHTSSAARTAAVFPNLIIFLLPVALFF